MENKKITPPEGYKFELISETEIKLVPIETKPKYPTKIEEIERHWSIWRDNGFAPFHSRSNDNFCSSESTALKFAAMMQLVELKDATNKVDKFVLDWDDRDQKKWCIYFSSELKELIVGSFNIISKPLAFSSQETAELFLNTHRALIEQAGDLV